MTTSLFEMTKSLFHCQCHICGCWFKTKRTPTQRKYCDDICAAASQGKNSFEHKERQENAKRNVWLMKSWRGEA